MYDTQCDIVCKIIIFYVPFLARIHFSDDHMFMRSKYLHRDEDMVLKNLKMIVRKTHVTISHVLL